MGEALPVYNGKPGWLCFHYKPMSSHKKESENLTHPLSLPCLPSPVLTLELNLTM